MKKNILAAALFSVVGFTGYSHAAGTSDAMQTFTWAGNVPAAPTTGSWVIKSPTEGPISNGALSFGINSAGDAELLGATDTEFAVFSNADGTVGPRATSYKYTLQNLKVSVGSNLAEETVSGSYFKLTANSTDMDKGVEYTSSSGSSTILRVVPNGDTVSAHKPMPGESISVQATILISDAS